MKLIKEKWHYILFLIPILDILKLIWPTHNIIVLISLACKFIIAFFFILGILFQKKSGYNKTCLVLIISFIIIEILYVYLRNFNLLKEGIHLLETLYFPIVLLFCNQKRNNNINDEFLNKIFWLYLFMFLAFINKTLSYEIEYLKSGIIGCIICLLPVIFHSLIKHNNILTKIVGFLLLFLGFYFWHSKILWISLIITILYFVWHERKDFKTSLKWLLPILIISSIFTYLSINTWFQIEINENNIDSVILNNRIEKIKENYQIFKESNFEEQLFGLGSIEELTMNITKIDLVDIFYNFGYFGLAFYFIILISILIKLKIKSYYRCSLYLTLFASIISGNILFSTTTSLWLGLILVANNNEKKKKILLISNMYPSKKYKHYGSFVKNIKNQLEELDYKIDLVVKKKHNFFFFKLVNYIKFYICSFFKGYINSYDYVYVHFLSHSLFPVALSSRLNKAKLICNAHGNDIVIDNEKDIKNPTRTKTAIKIAKVYKYVVPSKYYQEILINDYNIKENMIEVFPAGGIDLEVFKPLDKRECQEKLKLEKNHFYIGMISRIEKDKGWDTLIEALNKLKKESFFKNIKVIILGSGDLQKELDILIQKYKLGAKIIQKEFVSQEDLVNYYNAFDLFIFPTKRKSESLGLVGLEAMACKTPTIICNLYGPKEYAFHQKNSLTFKEDNGTELAKLIKKFMQMKENEKKEMIEEAYKTSHEYDKKKIKEKLSKIFE